MSQDKAEELSWLEKISAFLPFLLWWPDVNLNSLKADFFAGLTGAVIVLPQGIAFATIAGLPPEYGLYTAMITPVIAGLFGSSRHLISGPTTAISIVIFAAVSRHAEPGTDEFIKMALTLTFFAGVYQLVFGLARMGKLVNFVSHTVVIGFTAGAAVLIATSQLKHVIGVYVPSGESFLHTLVDIYRELGNANGYVLAVALVTLITAVTFKRFLPRWPNLLIGMAVGSVLAALLGGEEKGLAMVGAIPAHLPPLSHPDLTMSSIRELATEGFAIALLGLIEAVSISRSIASKSHQSINSNQEFVGQGLSNIVGSLFSSYAGSGSFTRSGVNYSSGAVTPMSAIFAALNLMLIILLVAPLMAYLPIAAMGGIILLVAYRLVDSHHIRKIIRLSKSETAILLVTFFATLFLELEFAIYLGVILSLVMFLSRTSTPDIIELAPDPDRNHRTLTSTDKKRLKKCPQLKIIRIDMSIYFGSTDYVQKKINYISERQRVKHILIIASGVNFIDVTGAEMLAQEAARLKAKGGGLYFCNNKDKVCTFLKKGAFIEAIGEENFFSEKSKAITSIAHQLNDKRCAKCARRIFTECDSLPGGENYNE